MCNSNFADIEHLSNKIQFLYKSHLSHIVLNLLYTSCALFSLYSLLFLLAFQKKWNTLHTLRRHNRKAYLKIMLHQNNKYKLSFILYILFLDKKIINSKKSIPRLSANNNIIGITFLSCFFNHQQLDLNFKAYIWVLCIIWNFFLNI